MSKTRHSHREYNTRGWCVTKPGPTEPKWGRSGPRCSSNMEALLESIQIRWSFLSYSLVECGSSTRILQILTESRLSSPFGVSGFLHIGIPTILPQSEWFANHSKSFIRFSNVICSFTYRIVELVFVLLYISSCVWGSIKYSGTQCGDYYLIPRRLTTLIRQKILDSTVNEVSEALSMHVMPLAIPIVVVPVEVTVLLGLHNPLVAGSVWWVPPYLPSL
jgi:hypothetical protein